MFISEGKAQYGVIRLGECHHLRVECASSVALPLCHKICMSYIVMVPDDAILLCHGRRVLWGVDTRRPPLVVMLPDDIRVVICAVGREGRWATWDEEG